MISINNSAQAGFQQLFGSKALQQHHILPCLWSVLLLKSICLAGCLVDSASKSTLRLLPQNL
jgi:hypothetical protein